MQDLNLKIFDSVNSELEKILYEGINVQAVLLRRMPPILGFAIELRDSDNQIQGGATGVSLYGNLYVDMLWIEKNLRGKGWGTAIMQQAENIGRNRGCSFATVNTMDWEALPFYAKLGFVIEFTREGFDHGAKMFFLRKPL